MLRQDDAIKAQLVFFGYRHGLRYGGHLASCMIMSVISNRIKAGWSSWLEALDRVPLFSAELEEPIGTPSLWDPNFVRLLVEVDSIYDGSMDHAKGGLYWADLTCVTNPWFTEKILQDPSNHPRCCNMNSLTLFK